MDRLNLQARTWRAAILAVLMLCAQAFAVAHEVSHDTGAHPDLCTTCSVGGNLTHSVEAAEFTVPVEVGHAARIVHETTRAVVASAAFSEARAPPSHS